MDAADRLASYLAGELGAEERAAFEAELTRDPAMRAQLEAIRRADAALEGLASPEPPAGFEDRLDAAVAAVLAETVHRAPAAVASTADATVPDGPAAAGGDPRQRDDLAERRAQRGRWAWRPALTGAAAALALIVAGIAVSRLADGGDDSGVSEVAMDAPAAEESDQPAADDEAPADDGPVVVLSDRDLDADDVDALLSGSEVTEVAGRGLDDVEGAVVAGWWQAALGSNGAAAMSEPFDGTDEDLDAAEQAPLVPPVEQRLLTERALTPDDEADLARCLEELLAADGRAIPAYVEFATFEDEPAIVYGLVTISPTSTAYTRTEAWVVSRDDCQVLRLSQSG